MRALWFSTIPGLAAQLLNRKGLGGGWIGALQAGVEASENLELGYVFYADNYMKEFVHGKTRYFPVKRIGNNKYKRFYHKLIAKLEYDENLQVFLNIIKAFKPDIIHIHGTENSFGLIIPHIPDIPVAISIQGNLTVYAEKYFSGIDKNAVKTKLDWLYNRVLLDYKGFLKGAQNESEILSYTKYIFGRTDWDRRIMRILAPNAKYFCVNEILRKHFYQHKWVFVKNEFPVFFTTSSENLFKGFETIVGTAMHLSKLKYKFQWIVAGLTMKDKQVQLVMKGKKISDLNTIGIKLMGKIPEEGIVKQMLSANIYVQVSHIENSPNSICEAMLLGLPIIATCAGGTSSLLKDNQSGILLQDGDAYSLAGALIELSEYPGLAVSLGAKAFEVSHERHNSGQVVQTLIRAYSDIINENSGIEVANLKLSRGR